MRGIAGHPADTDRDTGLQERPQGLPGHHGRPEQATASRPGGIRRPPPSSPTTSSPAATTTTSRASGRPAWTRGRRRHQGRRQEVRADRRRRPWWLRHQAPRPDELSGPRRRGRDQHRRRRRRGRQPGAQAPQRRDGHRPIRPAAQPNTVLLDPVLADNMTDAGKAHAAVVARSPASIPPGRSASRSRAAPTTPPSRPSPARARTTRSHRDRRTRGDAGAPASPPGIPPLT